jgi:DNA-binding transcriptional MocR family regulator
LPLSCGRQIVLGELKQDDQDLRRRIVRGDLAGGQALQSESVLMEEFAVSRARDVRGAEELRHPHLVEAEDYLLQNKSLTIVLDLLG